MKTSALKVFRLWLARPVLLHWVLPYLMLLLLVGTVAEKYIGLFESQRLFFSSFIFWAGPLPLPGGRTATGLLLLSLLAKTIYASPWHRRTAGIFVAHLGVILLLAGALLTAAFATEGYMVLAKNETGSGFSDYHQRMLAIRKNGQVVMQLPVSGLKAGEVIAAPALPFTIHINALCHNCTMAMRGEVTPGLKGSAQKVKLSGLPRELEDERNLAGAEVTLSGAGAADGTYLLFEPMEKHPAFGMGKDKYELTLGRELHALPFTLQLLDFDKEVYAGTTLPRSYRSTVLLTDGALRQRAVITMNHPLRYKGYTVYESSFNDGSSQSVTFAVVKNVGRVFPYVASITLCLGLLIHLSLRLPGLLKRGKHA